MLYNSQQLENGRWGIFINKRLIATIGCSNTCDSIISFLEASNQETQNTLVSAKIRNPIISYFRNLKLRS